MQIDDKHSYKASYQCHPSQNLASTVLSKVECKMFQYKHFSQM